MALDPQGALARVRKIEQALQIYRYSQIEQAMQIYRYSQSVGATNQQTQPNPAEPRVLMSVAPAEEKCHAAIRELTRQLPMRVAARIHSIKVITTEPYEVNVRANIRYRVRYSDERELEFADIDEFPTDADIARIVLEAP